jgi:protein translocase SecG subunit
LSIWNYITLVTTAVLVVLILIQTRGAGLGAGLGGGGEVHTVRRGSDKTIHQLTIILVFIFGASIILGIVVQ